MYFQDLVLSSCSSTRKHLRDHFWWDGNINFLAIARVIVVECVPLVFTSGLVIDVHEAADILHMYRKFTQVENWVVEVARSGGGLRSIAIVMFSSIGHARFRGALGLSGSALRSVSVDWCKRQYHVERFDQAVKVCEIDLDEQGRPHYKCWIPSRQRRQ